ncbi:hypothetical protein L195_g044417 [Trifolium pratense]|uniref:Uncharacterized protein n=1 Tax=Trifolium pratense TaxID=57577 RepID=A0A2K3MBZ9_TRIPR|nr:hypothetical protein L195_g044417 [Trifolium pratense]
MKQARNTYLNNQWDFLMKVQRNRSPEEEPNLQRMQNEIAGKNVEVEGEQNAIRMLHRASLDLFEANRQLSALKLQRFKMRVPKIYSGQTRSYPLPEW